MPSRRDPSASPTADEAGPRAILRVPEVLMALAVRRGGASLADLGAELKVPKTSLLRLLRTLERGGYLVHRAGHYALGPTAFHLGSLIGQAASATAFPASARPVLEELWRDTGETILLAVLRRPQLDVAYVDVIDSASPVRFTVPIGHTRELHAAASGKAVLAFLPDAERRHWLQHAPFTRFTPQTVTRAVLKPQLDEVRATALAHDDGGQVLGATGLAGPFFDAGGQVMGAVSAAGPTERLRDNRARIEPLVRAAAERISRILGFTGPYPPPG